MLSAPNQPHSLQGIYDVLSACGFVSSTPSSLSPYYYLSVCLSACPQVECPDELYDALVQTWDQNPQYVDVCDIIINDGGDEEDEDEEGDDDDAQDPTLLHTFYRWILL